MRRTRHLAREAGGARQRACVPHAYSLLQPARSRCACLTPRTTYSLPARGARRRPQALSAAFQASSTLSLTSSAGCVRARCHLTAFALVSNSSVRSRTSTPPCCNVTTCSIRQAAGQSCLRRFPQTAVAHTANKNVDAAATDHGSLFFATRTTPSARSTHGAHTYARSHELPGPLGLQDYVLLRRELSSRRLAMVSPCSPTLTSALTVYVGVSCVRDGLWTLDHGTRAWARRGYTLFMRARICLRIQGMTVVRFPRWSTLFWFLVSRSL